MPALSTFYGVIIRMYFYDNKQHHVPYIRAEYAEQRAVFGILDGELIAGTMPPNKTQLVKAWIEIHREELMADWNLAVTGQELFKIDPLK